MGSQWRELRTGVTNLFSLPKHHLPTCWWRLWVQEPRPGIRSDWPNASWMYFYMASCLLQTGPESCLSASQYGGCAYEARCLWEWVAEEGTKWHGRWCPFVGYIWTFLTEQVVQNPLVRRESSRDCTFQLVGKRSKTETKLFCIMLINKSFVSSWIYENWHRLRDKTRLESPQYRHRWRLLFRCQKTGSPQMHGFFRLSME